MSQENVEVIRRSIDHFNRTSEPAWHLIDPAITFTTCGDLEPSTTYEGIERFKELLAAFGTVWSEMRWDLERISGAGDTFVLDLLWHLRAAASGVPLEVRESWTVRLRDGRFVRIEQYGTRTEALEAAGLSE